MSDSDVVAGMTSVQCETLLAAFAPVCQTYRVPGNLILSYVRADQGQSQSPPASVWNEKYVCLKNKRKM